MKKMLLDRGFSDKLYYYNFRCVWAFVVACFLLNAASGFLDVVSLSVIDVGIPAAFTELGIHTAFMIWKAKAENCRKHKDINKVKELEEIEL